MKRQAVVSLLVVPALLVAFTASSFAGTKPAAHRSQMTPASVAVPPAKVAPAKVARASTAKAAELVDINSATKEKLAALPGIGDAFAQKIIDGRPYKAKNELKTRDVIPEAAYLKIARHIVAKKVAAK